MSYASGKNHPKFRHGMNGTPEFYAYQAMIQRCYNAKSKPFLRYGGRGIKVCDRWKNSPDNFFADMGSRPSPNHSLDRINNDGNYEPNNCRWATRKEQTNNRRSNRIVCYHGVGMSLARAVRLSPVKITRAIVKHRLGLGWTIDAAVDMPRIRNARGGKRYAIPEVVSWILGNAP